MKALIFNSGTGSRMGKLTADLPKCLVEVNGRTILSRQLKALTECGINDIIITTGKYENEIAAECRKTESAEITLVNNPLYYETNYIYSMYLASEYIDDDIIMMHGDLVFDTDYLYKLIHFPGDNSLCSVNRNSVLPLKDFKGRITGDRLTEVSVNIFDDNCFALQPLYRLTRRDVSVWISEVTKFVQTGKTDVYAENAFNAVSDRTNIREMSYEGYFVSEIDTPDDLAFAEKNIN